MAQARAISGSSSSTTAGEHRGRRGSSCSEASVCVPVGQLAADMLAGTQVLVLGADRAGGVGGDARPAGGAAFPVILLVACGVRMVALMPLQEVPGVSFGSRVLEGVQCRWCLLKQVGRVRMRL